MTPRPRVRKTITWGGAAIMLLLTACWIGSRWLHVSCLLHQWRLTIEYGSIMIVHLPPAVGFGERPGVYVGTMDDERLRLWHWMESGRNVRTLRVPMWIPVAAGLGLAVVWGGSWLAVRRRVRMGRCAACDYDRRGLTTGSPCPECGTRPAMERIGVSACSTHEMRTLSSRDAISRPMLAILRTAAICLVGGALITMGIAWGLAAWLPHSGWEEETVDGRGSTNRPSILFMSNYQTTGAARHAWNREYFAADRFFTPFGMAIENSKRTFRFGDPRPLAGLDWGIAEQVRSDPEAFVQDGCEHATGWPFLSSWYGLSLTEQRGVTVEGGIPLFESAQGGWFMASELRALPLKIIWRGFAVDSALYAALLFGAWQASPAMRRHRRQRKGLCARCGYDRAGIASEAPCPECGASR